MLTRAPSFFFPRVVRSSVSGIKWTQKRVGVTSPTVRLIPSMPINPLLQDIFHQLTILDFKPDLTIIFRG